MNLDRYSFHQIGKLYESECSECGNVDRLTESETKRIVHCQIRYNHYEYKGDKK